MKKLLALVLALVMILGLATVSTSAAYSDQDDINNEEAVAVMTAIGIFEGKSGAFDPKANLNRAEAAKIVAYLMLGNETAENLQGTGAKFTDVPASHWAAGYIEYLASVGIVSGVGGGRFDPNGQVTAVQLAKMLLVALGYDAQIEKFVGSDWAINIQSVANKVGIYDGNSKVVSNAAVTRDEAALYALNTIKAPLVEYSTKGTVITIGDASVTTGASNWSYKTTAVKNNGKKLQTIDDTTLNGNDEAYIVEFAEEYYPDLKLESDTNDFGEPIHKWLNKNIEVGTFVLTSDLLETYTAKVTAKTLYDLLGKSRRDSIEANDTTITFFEDGDAYISFGEDGDYSGKSDLLDEYLSRNDTYKISNTGNGSVTEVFVDGDNDITVVTYHTYVYQASNNYNSSTQNLSIKVAGNTAAEGHALKSSTISSKDYPVIEDVKADDYLLVAVYKDGNGYSVGKVEKATLLTGNVDSYKVNSNVVIDGETKEYSNKTTDHGDIRETLYSVGQGTTVVLDKYGYIIAVDDAIVNANYLFVTKFGSSSGLNTDTYASAYFTDGTSEDIRIDKVYKANGTDKIAASTLVSGDLGKTLTTAGALNGSSTLKWSNDYAGWYTFSKSSDGKYTLYTPRTADNWAQAAESYTANNAKVTVNDKVQFLGDAPAADLNGSFVNASTLAKENAKSTLRANSKTIFVVKDEYADDIMVYTGVKNTPDITLVTSSANEDATGAVVFALYKTTTGYADYVFVTTQGNNTQLYDGSNEALLYIEGDEGTYHRTNNEVYYKWRVLDENAKFVAVNATKPAPASYEAVYRVRTNSDEEYTDGTPIAGTHAGDVYYNGKYISIKNVINGNDAKYAGSGSTATGKGAADAGKIVYKDNTLWLDKIGFTLADNAKITLVLHKDAVGLLDNKKADREAYVVTASDLASRLNDYPFAKYCVQARLDDNWLDGSRTIQEAYVTVLDDDARDTYEYTVTFNQKVGAADETALKQAGTNNAPSVFIGSATTALNANDATNTTKVTNGNSLSFKVTAPAGYSVASVKRGGTVITPVGSVYTLSNVTANTTVTINLFQNGEVSVTGANFDFVVDGTAISGTGTTTGKNFTVANTAISVTVTPKAGYKIATVTGTGLTGSVNATTGVWTGTLNYSQGNSITATAATNSMTYTVVYKDRTNNMTVKTASAVTVDGSATPAATDEWAFNGDKTKVTVTYKDTGSKSAESLPVGYTWYAGNAASETFNFVDGGNQELIVFVDAAPQTYTVNYVGVTGAPITAVTGVTLTGTDLSGSASNVAANTAVTITPTGDGYIYTVKVNNAVVDTTEAGTGVTVFVTGNTNIVVTRAAKPADPTYTVSYTGVDGAALTTDGVLKIAGSNVTESPKSDVALGAAIVVTPSDDSGNYLYTVKVNNVEVATTTGEAVNLSCTGNMSIVVTRRALSATLVVNYIANGATYQYSSEVIAKADWNNTTVIAPVVSGYEADAATKSTSDFPGDGLTRTVTFNMTQKTYTVGAIENWTTGDITVTVERSTTTAKMGDVITLTIKSNAAAATSDASRGLHITNATLVNAVNHNVDSDNIRITGAADGNTVTVTHVNTKSNPVTQTITITPTGDGNITFGWDA